MKSTNVIAILVTVLFAGSWVSEASALNCDILSMEQSYEQSSTVFLAQILSAELIEEVHYDGVRKQRPMVRHYFKLVEVFKGEVTYDSFDSELVWNEDVAHFAIGDINLFFMGVEPGFNSCQPRYLLGQPDTTYVLEKLRRLKEGQIDSMSGSWVTNVSDSRCSLYTTYVLDELNGAVSLSFGHSKATGVRGARWGLWVYSQARSEHQVVSSAGFSLFFLDEKISIPASGRSKENSANFFTRTDTINRLLSEVLGGGAVHLEASTRDDQPVEIDVLLNGGQAAIHAFAECGDLSLQASASDR